MRNDQKRKKEDHGKKISYHSRGISSGCLVGRDTFKGLRRNRISSFRGHDSEHGGVDGRG